MGGGLVLVLVRMRSVCFTEPKPKQIVLPRGQAPGPHPSPHPPLVPTGRGRMVSIIPDSVGKIHQDGGDVSYHYLIRLAKIHQEGRYSLLRAGGHCRF